MNDNELFPLLPDALCQPTGHCNFKGDRAGVDLAQARFGAGSPAPCIHNEAGRLTLGRVFLAAGVRLWSHKGGELSIGDGTVLDSGAEIISWMRVTIGRDCYLGWDVLVMDTDLHGVGNRPLVNRPVTIGDHVRIGARAMILKGVTIGNDAIIQPGSIVTGDVPSGAEIAPSPATVRPRVVS